MKYLFLFKRNRPPRFFRGDGVVRYYDFKEAEGAQYLRELEKGKYAHSDTYVIHEYEHNLGAADKKSVLLVSNKRVLFITYSQVLGTWSISWEFSLREIAETPPVEKDDLGYTKWYLYIEPKNAREKTLGLFGGVTKKKVEMPSGKVARTIANRIEQTRIECVTSE